MTHARFAKRTLAIAGLAIVLTGCTPQPTLEDAMVACVEVYAETYPDNTEDVCVELYAKVGEGQFVEAFTDARTRDAIEDGVLR